MGYNPYDLIPVTVNNVGDLYARPVEFDSEVVDLIEMTNADGQVIMPSRIETACPDCGSVVSMEVKLFNPPFDIINCICGECNPVPVPAADPFINPIETGRIKPSDLDPVILNPAEDIDDNPTITVADKLKTGKAAKKKAKKAKKAKKSVGETPTTKKTEKSVGAKKVKKKAKRGPSEPPEKPAPVFKAGNLGPKITEDLSPNITSSSKNQRLASLEPAEDIDKESDFNDDDLVD